MSKLRKVLEIHDPQGGRNFIREGDDVKVLAGPGNKTSYTARFCYGEIDESDSLVQVTTFGGYRGRASATHTYRPTRLRRVAQTRDGEKIGRTRGSRDAEV